MFNFWGSIALSVVGCVTVGALIARTVRMNRSQLARFFFGPKCVWQIYPGIATATLAWANTLVAFRKGHWGWHVFQVTVMVFAWIYTLFMHARARRGGDEDGNAEVTPN